MNFLIWNETINSLLNMRCFTGFDVLFYFYLSLRPRTDKISEIVTLSALKRSPNINTRSCFVFESRPIMIGILRKLKIASVVRIKSEKCFK